MKICCRCKIEKSYDCFYKWNKSKDGFTSYCRECKKKDYKENREHYLEIDKKSRNKKDKETIKLERKLYRQKHRDRINKCSFDNYHKNKPDRKIKRDKYRSENKDAIKQQKREFYKKHKEKKLKELEVLENNFIGPKIPQDYRFCNTCGKLKNINEFGNSSSNKRWKSRRCKICAAEKRLKYNSTIEMRLINRVRQSLRKSLTAFLFKERNRTLDYLGCVEVIDLLRDVEFRVDIQAVVVLAGLHHLVRAVVVVYGDCRHLGVVRDISRHFAREIR
jgi:hypothetical protein